MNTDYFPGKARLRAGLASLLLLALAGAVFGCGDEEETVQQTEMQEQSSQLEGERPPPREGPDGCYVPAQRSCDCAVSEADCTEDVGVWTMGCASCPAP